MVLGYGQKCTLKKFHVPGDPVSLSALMTLALRDLPLLNECHCCQRMQKPHWKFAILFLASWLQGKNLIPDRRTVTTAAPLSPHVTTDPSACNLVL